MASVNTDAVTLMYPEHGKGLAYIPPVIERETSTSNPVHLTHHHRSYLQDADSILTLIAYARVTARFHHGNSTHEVVHRYGPAPDISNDGHKSITKNTVHENH
jgi:hypothetical protein